jgi:hypothetical protein
MIVISIFGMHSVRTSAAARAVMDRVHRAEAADNLRTIAIARLQFIPDFSWAISFSNLKNLSRDNACYATNFAAFLGKYGFIEDFFIKAWSFD